MLTIGFIRFTSLSLQTLPQELLLFSQILLDEAVLAHLLTDLNTEVVQVSIHLTENVNFTDLDAIIVQACCSARCRVVCSCTVVTHTQ